MSLFVPGTPIYKYVLKRCLGAGSFGEVWLSHDKTIDKDIAVKIVKADGPLTIDPLKEARIGNRFEHDNLVKVHYADVVNLLGENYIVIAMDYLEKGSILSQLNSRGFLPLPRALEVMRNILFGLDRLHYMGFYHNDIKPSNILVGGTGQAVLSDYGVSLRADEATNGPSYYLHTAPELLSGGNINIHTDIYQCGLTAFRLLCGVDLLEARWSNAGQAQYVKDIQSGTLVTQKDFPEFIPSQVRRRILKAISRNPVERYQTAIDMQRDFEKLSYSGFWDSNEHNQLIGRKIQNKNIYVYNEIPSKSKTFDFEARIIYPSGKSNRILQFCKQGITKAELMKTRKAYMQWVITS